MKSLKTLVLEGYLEYDKPFDRYKPLKCTFCGSEDFGLEKKEDDSNLDHYTMYTYETKCRICDKVFGIWKWDWEKRKQYIYTSYAAEDDVTTKVHNEIKRLFGIQNNDIL